MKSLITLSMMFFALSAQAGYVNGAAYLMSLQGSIQTRLTPRDCKAIHNENWLDCHSGDCSALIFQTPASCGTWDCRAIASWDARACKSSECKALILKDITYCETQNCEALISQNADSCADGACYDWIHFGRLNCQE